MLVEPARSTLDEWQHACLPNTNESQEFQSDPGNPGASRPFVHTLSFMGIELVA